MENFLWVGKIMKSDLEILFWFWSYSFEEGKAGREGPCIESLWIVVVVRGHGIVICVGSFRCQVREVLLCDGRLRDEVRRGHGDVETFAVATHFELGVVVVLAEEKAVNDVLGWDELFFR